MQVPPKSATIVAGLAALVSLTGCGAEAPPAAPSHSAAPVQPADEPVQVAQAPAETPAPAPAQRPVPRTEATQQLVSSLDEVDAGQFDPLSVPMDDGIVWYGVWEDAMAEFERTGKPVAIHFGSPRCPSGYVCVPGTW
jgi:hypothetical protein